MTRCSVLFAILFSLLAVDARGQSGGATRTNTPPWPVILGAKVALCEGKRPVVSRVVLVDDPDTFLQEVARWSPAGQWPVLFESDPRTAAFIRAFVPEEIVHVAPTPRRLPVEEEIRERLMLGACSIAWGAADPRMPQEQLFERLGWRPPGLVVTSVGDPAWTAAVTLAAGRGLPLVFVDDQLGAVNGEMSSAEVRRFEREIRDAATKTGYDWKELGDDLDAVAICRAMPVRCRMTPPAAARVSLGDRDAGDGPWATTDVLCRHDDGSRWGYAGWIWGDEGRAASVAMSSLFLQRRNAWFISGYPQNGAWGNYAVEEAAVELAEAGYASLFFEGEKASLVEWRRLLLGGLPADILYLNSHGTSRQFHLFEDQRAVPQDMPFIQRPMALSMVHSFSLQNPADRNTVGGRALDRGVYAYIGSVDEPYLTAFVPPLLQTRRIRAGVPFLLAGRQWPGSGPMAGIWKITTIGDPFMIAPPPGAVTVPTVSIEDAKPIPDSTDLVDLARTDMKAIADDPSRASDAVRRLVILGKDELAIDVWESLVAKADPVAIAAAAPQVIDPLFRARRWNDFIDAFDRLPLESRDSDARDMLWHLAGPRLSSIQDPRAIAVLRREIREPQVQADLGLLMPHLDRVLGAGAGQAELSRRIEAERNPARRITLEKLR